MTGTQILLYAMLIVLLYLVYIYMIKGSSNKLTGLMSAKTPYVVSEDTVRTLNGNQQIYNYTVSVWIYVDNWVITTGKPKPVLTIDSALNVSLGDVDNELSVEVLPSNSFTLMNPIRSIFGTEGLETMNLTRTKKQKDGMQSITGSIFHSPTAVAQANKNRNGHGGKSSTEGYTKVSTSATTKNANKRSEGFLNLTPVREGVDNLTAVVPTIPLQAWTQIAVSVHDRAVDVYINGKLVQSNLASYVPGPVNTSIILTPDDGFIGWTSNLEYFPYTLTPNQIGNIYNSGYTGSREGILSVLGKYSMKLVFVDNTQQQ